MERAGPENSPSIGQQWLEAMAKLDEPATDDDVRKFINQEIKPDCETDFKNLTQDEQELLINASKLTTTEYFLLADPKFPKSHSIHILLSSLRYMLK